MTDGLPVSPRCRVIVDNDYQGDPDGLVALAHHLLSPSNRVAVITSSFLNPRWPVASPLAEDGAALARELLEVELYDMEADPLEYQNLYHDPDYRAVRDELAHTMLTWLIDTSDVVPWEGHVEEGIDADRGSQVAEVPN
jgi:hypothetical protein